MRLDELDPTTLTDRQRELSDRIVARRGAVRGPYRAWLNSPEACERVEALGAFARFESSLPEHLRLLTLLVACRAFDAQYSWNAHVGQALDAGIPQHVIDAIAHQRTPAFDDPSDQVFWEFCDELVREHFVSDTVFALARRLFTAQQLVDTIASLGNYTMLSMCLNAFEVDLQTGVEPPFPDVRGFARV
ncbi:carboxymuconolactone decarboxylase family protein [Microbacterium invictum]|uniref:4-carboxymuconolactone decarboxylase n=1 Tax=Microbacterium invictum TaxID=515415 RepID=A0AA40VN36_9MICO|nr:MULTISPECIES: carboxymuconolactone decarboxylase family protein [Microbacterium]MBB4140492.1 4-carboxymuconolactone decarboxylase [Microbacterium invictum]